MTFGIDYLGGRVPRVIFSPGELLAMYEPAPNVGRRLVPDKMDGLFILTEYMVIPLCRSPAGKGRTDIMDEKKPQEVKLEIQLDEEVAQGVYVNLAVVNHNESEFVIDLIFVQPQAPRAKVRSRVILSPPHAKRFAAALQENISRYEKNFGEIKSTQQIADESAGHYH